MSMRLCTHLHEDGCRGTKNTKKKHQQSIEFHLLLVTFGLHFGPFGRPLGIKMVEILGYSLRVPQKRPPKSPTWIQNGTNMVAKMEPKLSQMVANWKQNAVTSDKVNNFSLQPSFFLILKDVTK